MTPNERTLEVKTLNLKAKHCGCDKLDTRASGQPLIRVFRFTILCQTRQMHYLFRAPVGLDASPACYAVRTTYSQLNSCLNGLHAASI